MLVWPQLVLCRRIIKLHLETPPWRHEQQHDQCLTRAIDFFKSVDNEERALELKIQADGLIYYEYDSDEEDPFNGDEEDPKWVIRFLEGLPRSERVSIDLHLSSKDVFVIICIGEGYDKQCWRAVTALSFDADDDNTSAGSNSFNLITRNLTHLDRLRSLSVPNVAAFLLFPSSYEKSLDETHGDNSEEFFEWFITAAPPDVVVEVGFEDSSWGDVPHPLPWLLMHAAQATVDTLNVKYGDQGVVLRLRCIESNEHEIDKSAAGANAEFKWSAVLECVTEGESAVRKLNLKYPVK
jgi:hypothetical protein